jgi:UDP-glucose 4-epimerase
MNRMSKICVIGGSGFLGSHVCESLIAKGYKVIIFDNQKPNWFMSENDFHIGSIEDLESVKEVTKDCCAVFNFAAIADLDTAINRPLDTVKINILGNTNILEACKLNKVSHYVYASTVYVNSREGGFYRCSKHAAELYVEEYQKKYGLDYTILRYGSLYGPRCGQNNGLKKIIRNTLINGYIEYEGSSDSMREYIHVYDAAEATANVLDKKFLNQKIIITGQELMKVRDLLEMISEILGLNKEIKFNENHQIGHYRRIPYSHDLQIAKKYVLPVHIDLGQGLVELIKEVELELINRI